jgi:UDP-3-O-[3-hydroxymyristoyl] glucosamine N-acyltransferase
MIDPRFYTLREKGLSLADLCAQLGLLAPEGSFSDIIVKRPASLAQSQAGDVTFLLGRDGVEDFKTAKPTACFTTEKYASVVSESHCVPIVTPTPKYHLAKTTAMLVHEQTEQAAEIHPTAKVHKSAVIGEGVVIGANTLIGANAVIEKAFIGEGCNIGACTVIGGTGFGVVSGPGGDVLSVPHVGRVIVKDRASIGSNCCIDRGQLGDTIIGEDTKIDNLVQIAHNCHIGKRCFLAGCVGLSGSCIIGDDVLMGGSVGLADHVIVGDKARLAAFAGVMHNIPAGETWSGIPAVPIREHMRMVAHTRRAIKK